MFKQIKHIKTLKIFNFTYILLQTIITLSTNYSIFFQTHLDLIKLIYPKFLFNFIITNSLLWALPFLFLFIWLGLLLIFYISYVIALLVLSSPAIKKEKKDINLLKIPKNYKNVNVLSFTSKIINNNLRDLVSYVNFIFGSRLYLEFPIVLLVFITLLIINNVNLQGLNIQTYIFVSESTLEPLFIYTSWSIFIISF